MPAPTTLKATKLTPSSHHRPSPSKTRFAKRRGRANGFHSDEEIEREARSDSDTDEDGQSSGDSDSDSETEPASEDAPQNGTCPIAQSQYNTVCPSMNWSEMVMDEVANVSADLPVIDFADLAAAAASSGQAVSEDEPKSTSVSGPPRRGQTARQAYQERLENDPSYVPTVGEFWGHDDRLLDKDLRSLSGWWRGRWQGGARGRGFGVRGRGRGRGRGGAHAINDSHPNGDGEVPSSSPADLPPVDRPWTHDGFEEQKRREEQRSQRQDQTQGSNSNSRGVRGGFGPRGRGFGRGRFSPRPGTTRSTDSPTSMSPRTWFLIKPERPWTKHHELFLYSDPSQRPRPGQGPAYRIKLPGTSSAAVVQSPAQPSPPRAPTPPREERHEDGEIVFTVSLPRGQREPDIAESTPTTAAAPSPQPAPTLPPQEVAEVAPVQVPAPPSLSITPVVTSPPELHVAIEEEPMPTSEATHDDPFKLRDPPPPTVIPLPTSTPTQTNPAASTPSSAVSPSAPAPVPHSATAPEGGLLWRSPPPHLQTTFAQPAPASGYASPYTYPTVSAPTVPPGVALDAHGMPYDLATGRPLYMTAPAQVPTPVYMMPYAHMHQHMQHRPHASPDPSLFAPPRQSSRIEIRRPDGLSMSDEVRHPSVHGQTHASRPSTLRASASAPAFVPSQAQGLPPPAPHEFYPSPPPEVPPAPAPSAMMGYPYPQPPYYTYGAPEGYGYPPPQFVEYEAYGADPRGGAPAVPAVYY
ncbi:hypothetical protein BJY52DRAFT_1212741 [Lactarius psammicola]|nr:hypothetical protein BJY52DRAFT_1212741 [Lactarius psammicola]